MPSTAATTVVGARVGGITVGAQRTRWLASISSRQLPAIHAIPREIGDSQRPVVEEENGAIPGREIVLQRQDLPAIAQWVLRQETQLRQAVEYEARRIDPLYLCLDPVNGFTELDFPRVQQRNFPIGIDQRTVTESADSGSFRRARQTKSGHAWPGRNTASIHGMFSSPTVLPRWRLRRRFSIAGYRTGLSI
jgi:hypothetical protein